MGIGEFDVIAWGEPGIEVTFEDKDCHVLDYDLEKRMVKLYDGEYTFWTSHEHIELKP